MPVTRDDEHVRLGFLTAVEVPERGYVGGLLVTNRFGRPLEFQCTSPVKPNRTQEILYGPTLVPFVLGELIGRTLLDKVAVKPHLVLTEQPEMLEVRQHVSLPVACIDENGVDVEAIEDAEAEVAGEESGVGSQESAEGSSIADSSPAQLRACSENQESGIGNQESANVNQESVQFSSPSMEEDTDGGETATAAAAESTAYSPESPPIDLATDPVREASAPNETIMSTDTQDPRASGDADQPAALPDPTSTVPMSECAAIADSAAGEELDAAQLPAGDAATLLSIDAPKSPAAVASEPLGQELTVDSLPAESIAVVLETAIPESEPAEQPKPAERRRRRSSTRTDETTVALGKQILRFHDTHPADCAAARQTTSSLPRNVDLREPFQRVREALAETMRAGATR